MHGWSGIANLVAFSSYLILVARLAMRVGLVTVALILAVNLFSINIGELEFWFALMGRCCH